METLALYLAEGHFHKFSVYCDHSIDFSAHPRTQCAHRMTSSLAIVRGSLFHHIFFYCGNSYFTTSEPHNPMLAPAFPGQLKGSKRQNSSLSSFLPCLPSLSLISSHSFQLLSHTPSFFFFYFFLFNASLKRYFKM